MSFPQTFSFLQRLRQGWVMRPLHCFIFQPLGPTEQLCECWDPWGTHPTWLRSFFPTQMKFLGCFSLLKRQLPISMVDCLYPS